MQNNVVEVVTRDAFVSNAARPVVEQIPEFISHADGIESDSGSDSGSDSFIDIDSFIDSGIDSFTDSGIDSLTDITIL